MPITYYIITNKYVKKLVDNNNLYELDNYLLNGSNVSESNIFYRDINHSCLPPWMDDCECSSYDNRLYHILSYATSIGNYRVLNYYRDKIDIDNKCNDGNAYDLVYLSIESYLKNFSTNEAENNNRFNIIICILESQINKNKQKNKQKNKFKIPVFELIYFYKNYQDYNLIYLLLTKYDQSLIEIIYKSAISSGLEHLFDWLITNFYDKINFEWSEEAFYEAYNNDNDEIIMYVLSKIKLLNNEIYIELEYLDYSSKFIIKSINNLKIPEYITCIKTACYFNESIDDVKLPDGLLELHFGENFNESIVDVKLPNGLLELHFGFSFNKSLDNVIFPESLEEITFGLHNNSSLFNRSIKNVLFPKSLKVFWNNGHIRDKLISTIQLPDSIEEENLKIGTYDSDSDFEN